MWNPASARHGIPSGFPSERSARDIWQWLALLGGAGLFADWILFGRRASRAEPCSGRLTRGLATGWASSSEMEEGVMTFEHPWVLIAAVLPLVWWCSSGADYAQTAAVL